MAMSELLMYQPATRIDADMSAAGEEIAEEIDLIV